MSYSKNKKPGSCIDEVITPPTITRFGQGTEKKLSLRMGK